MHDRIATHPITHRPEQHRLISVTIPVLSAFVSETVADPRQEPAHSFLPPVLPGIQKKLTEPFRTSIRVVVDQIGDKPQILFDKSLPITFLSRNSSFNSVKGKDLTAYYGAWVTPYAQPVQQLIREASNTTKNNRPVMIGYQGDALEKSALSQVKALYETLQKTGIHYVNSVIDYGMGSGFATQRTRLPRESLKLKSANCIDGTVLFASLLEGCSLNPAIVMVPGHAFLGWQKHPDKPNDWGYVETTMITSHKFEEAEKSAETQMKHRIKDRSVRVHPITALRAQGILPME